ncbi:CDK-activating kinase assembly factor MAT1 isoform X2 [Hydra vulgaris]|uniref:CDK-activating kinase assembly factor MAT1 isoform X2 n=1 Tax=Hydra vulgaris TaxID=6087 RepID=A0ABM4CKT8_HYDVU
MDEQTCPRCKTTSYRNKSLKLLVNVCGHKLCQTCVDVLFTRPSAACPQCNTALRRSDFRNQLFEDDAVEKEVDVRKKILKIYNKREDDFNSLDEFNNYLEDIEIIIFNIVNKISVEETKKKIELYKKENERLIKKNQSKLNQEEAMYLAILQNEKEDYANKRKKIIQEELDTEKRKCKEKENLINDLIYANAPAEEVIARHVNVKRRKEEEEAKKSFFFSEKKKNLKLVSQPIIEAPLFEYKAPIIEWFGPTPPDETDIIKIGYLKHIRSAQPAERAGGYTESIACRRALQEAFDSLFI